jgi:glycosyltransferase involved in cell wall biosynthesis
MKVFLLIPELAWSGAAKQLFLLASGLPRQRFTVRVGVMGRDGPWGNSLRAAGLDVDVLGWTRLIDARPIRRLRQLVQEIRPDVIHGWGWSVLRASLMLGDQPRLLVNTGLLPQGPGARVNLLDRWLLQRTDRIIAWNEVEVHTHRQLGVPAEKLAVIAPAVALTETAPADPRAFRAEHRLPDNARLLIGIGPLEPAKGFRKAIWAFDIVKYLDDDLHLVLIGDGSDRDRLEGFARSINALDRVHLVGPQTDVSAWLAQADVVWIPSLAETGANVALEAMAAGRPVVANRWPRLAEIIADGETGYLVSPGDKAALARQTRWLLDDAGRRQQFGEAGRKRVGSRFAVAELVRRHIELYQGAHGDSHMPEVPAKDASGTPAKD